MCARQRLPFASTSKCAATEARTPWVIGPHIVLYGTQGTQGVLYVLEGPHSLVAEPRLNHDLHARDIVPLNWDAVS